MDEEILYESPVPETEQAEDEIIRLKKMAATDEFAALDLGIHYITGNGVERDPGEALRWFARSGSALARYSSALIYYNRKEFSKAEQELLQGLETKEMADAHVRPLCALTLGKLYLQDWKPEGRESSKLAVRYLEYGLEMDPTQGGEYAGLLGMACEELGMQYDAVHWYRTAIEEFGQKQYRERLFSIYLTGIVGNARKREAEEAMG